MRRLHKNSIAIIGLSVFFLTGCQKYYLSLTDQKVDVNSLASTYVGSPDKRQHSPPLGQLVVMDWRIPRFILPEGPFIELFVLYGNYTEKKFTFPIDKRMGYVVYKNLNEEFVDNKGIISYRADIKLADGQIYKSWTHQLWVNLISVDEDEEVIHSEFKDISINDELDLPSLNQEEESDSSFTD